MDGGRLTVPVAFNWSRDEDMIAVFFGMCLLENHLEVVVVVMYMRWGEKFRVVNAGLAGWRGRV